MARLGDLSPFGRLLKAHGDNYFAPNRPNFWRLFGRFLKDGSNLNFLCYKDNLNLKVWATFAPKRVPKKCLFSNQKSQTWHKISLWATFAPNRGPKICHFNHKNKSKLTRRFWATFFLALGDFLPKPSGHPARPQKVNKHHNILIYVCGKKLNSTGERPNKTVKSTRYISNFIK